LFSVVAVVQQKLCEVYKLYVHDHDRQNRKIID